MAMDNLRFAECYGIAATPENLHQVNRFRTAASWMRNRARIRCGFHNGGPIDEPRWYRECRAIDQWEAARAERLHAPQGLTWTPRIGDTVHLRIPAESQHNGRYRVAHCGRQIELHRINGRAKSYRIHRDELHDFIACGYVTPIDPAELERDRKTLELRTLAPLRKPREQHDVDGLALFDRVRSPAML